MYFPLCRTMFLSKRNASTHDDAEMTMSKGINVYNTPASLFHTLGTYAGIVPVPQLRTPAKERKIPSM